MGDTDGVDMKELEKTFQQFAAHGKPGKGMKIEMDGKNFSKCCRDCKVIDKKVTTTDVDIVFSKVKAKTARVITFEQFKTALTELAGKKFKGDADAVKKTMNLVAGNGPQNTGVTKTSKTGGVAKMTDTSQYTGAHKERFDESGKGKGIAGREELSDNSGFVGNYKGEGTYDKKAGK